MFPPPVFIPVRCKVQLQGELFPRRFNTLLHYIGCRASAVGDRGTTIHRMTTIGCRQGSLLLQGRERVTTRVSLLQVVHQQDHGHLDLLLGGPCRSGGGWNWWLVVEAASQRQRERLLIACLYTDLWAVNSCLEGIFNISLWTYKLKLIILYLS